MKTATINSRWIGLHPSKRMDAPYWLKVVEVLQGQGLENPNGATDEQVKAAIEIVDEGEHLPIITQLACIQIALQFFKDRIPHNEWESTPLPVIAAPVAWMRGVAKFMGAPDDQLPAEIYGCSVIQKEEIDQPVLITHDGKAYRVNDFVDKNAKPEPTDLVLH